MADAEVQKLKLAMTLLVRMQLPMQPTPRLTVPRVHGPPLQAIELMVLLPQEV